MVKTARRLLARTHPCESPSFTCSVDLESPDAPLYFQTGGFGANAGNFPLREATSFQDELSRSGAGWLLKLAATEEERGAVFTPFEILERALQVRVQAIKDKFGERREFTLESDFSSPLAAKWIELSEARVFDQQPVKVELEPSGRVIGFEEDSQVRKRRDAIAEALGRELPFGEIVTPVVVTLSGVRKPSIGWAMPGHVPEVQPCPSFRSPDIWIDIAPARMLQRHVRERHQSIFMAGARECWICQPSGKISFFGLTGVLPMSEICPVFPLFA